MKIDSFVVFFFQVLSIMLIKFFIIFIIIFFFFIIFVPKPFSKVFKNFFKSDIFSNISSFPFLDTSLINKSLQLKHFTYNSFFLFKQSQTLHDSLYKKIPIVFEKSYIFFYSFFLDFFKRFDFSFFNSFFFKKYYLQQVKIKRFLFNF